MLDPFKHNTAMNRLSLEERAKIIGCLVEGNSVRSTARITNTDKKTVLRLLADVGAACKRYHDERVFMIETKRVQCDEIWSFCYAKEKNIPADMAGVFGIGDVWTWTAIDADTKLMIGYRVDRRDETAARHFMEDLYKRLATRVQLTTDGLRVYLTSVPQTFGRDIDYGMLRKIYSNPKAGEGRYSPGECCGIQRRKLIGKPIERAISTSYVERQNLSTRMGMRRFTRLTNAFSKKVENHMHAISLYFLHYNFARIHQTLRVTPAMEAGLSNHVWSLEEIAALADSPELVTA
jgi:IS1 family transposase